MEKMEFTQILSRFNSKMPLFASFPEKASSRFLDLPPNTEYRHYACKAVDVNKFTCEISLRAQIGIFAPS